MKRVICLLAIGVLTEVTASNLGDRGLHRLQPRRAVQRRYADDQIDFKENFVDEEVGRDPVERFQQQPRHRLDQRLDQNSEHPPGRGFIQHPFLRPSLHHTRRVGLPLRQRFLQGPNSVSRPARDQTENQEDDEGVEQKPDVKVEQRFYQQVDREVDQQFDEDRDEERGQYSDEPDDQQPDQDHDEERNQYSDTFDDQDDDHNPDHKSGQDSDQGSDFGLDPELAEQPGLNSDKRFNQRFNQRFVLRDNRRQNWRSSERFRQPIFQRSDRLFNRNFEQHSEEEFNPQAKQAHEQRFDEELDQRSDRDIGERLNQRSDRQHGFQLQNDLDRRTIWRFNNKNPIERHNLLSRDLLDQQNHYSADWATNQQQSRRRLYQPRESRPILLHPERKPPGHVYYRSFQRNAEEPESNPSKSPDQVLEPRPDKPSRQLDEQDLDEQPDPSAGHSKADESHATTASADSAPTPANGGSRNAGSDISSSASSGNESAGGSSGTTSLEGDTRSDELRLPRRFGAGTVRVVRRVRPVKTASRLPSRRREPPVIFHAPIPYVYGYGGQSAVGIQHSRREVSDGLRAKGSFTQRMPDGRTRTVEYVADEKGFRIVAMKDVYDDPRMELERRKPVKPVEDIVRPRWNPVRRKTSVNSAARR